MGKGPPGTPRQPEKGEAPAEKTGRPGQSTRRTGAGSRRLGEGQEHREKADLVLLTSPGGEAVRFVKR